MRTLIAASVCLITGGLIAAPPDPARPDPKSKAAPAPIAPKAGIKTPGIQIPFESLKSDAEIPLETPGWVNAADAIFVAGKSKGIVARVDAKANKVLDPIPDLKQPCSGTLVAFGSLWIPECGAQKVTRFDTKANKVTAAIATGAANVTMALASSSDSVWMLVDSKTTLARIDPEQNKVVAELRLPAACNSIAFGENSLWVTCPSETRLLRINPATNLVEKRIDVSAGARSVAFGASSVWVLSEKEGKVDRIDPKTNKVVKTIDLAVPNAGGNLAFGAGFLWVTQTGFPLTRIDPESDKERVAQQFWGDGGGLVSVTANAIWISNVNKGTVTRFDPKRVIATLAE
jgi:streptogramin lyase